MTLPEVGELWEYKQAKQLLRVLVLGVRGDITGDGVRIQTINIVCEGFGQDHDEWWFSTSHNVKDCWTRLA